MWTRKTHKKRNNIAKREGLGEKGRKGGGGETKNGPKALNTGTQSGNGMAPFILKGGSGLEGGCWLGGKKASHLEKVRGKGTGRVRWGLRTAGGGRTVEFF